MPFRPMRHLVLTCLLAAALSSCLSPAQASLLPVHVINALDRARSGEPVSFGIPIAREARTTDPSLLSVKSSDGHAVPCQFKVLSRWGAPREEVAAPLKWVLLTIEPEVAPKSKSDFTVEYGAAPARDGVTHQVSPDGSEIRIRTSPLFAFAVPITTFAPFASVSLDGSAEGPVKSAGSIAMTDAGKKPIPASVTSPTKVEESGPLRVVLAQRGTLGALRYTCRWYFHAGRSDVALDFRLENPLAYGLFDPAIKGGEQYFESLEIVQPVAGADHAVTSAAGTTPLQPGQLYEIGQTWNAGNPNDVLSGFSFTESLDGAKVAAGRFHAGAIDLSGTKGGVTVCVERFWENFPKAFAARDGEIRVALFPAFGHGPEFRGQRSSPKEKDHPVDPQALEHYRFEGGRWKSHRIVFDFHAGTRASADVALVAAGVEAPLAGYPEPAAVRKSRAMGFLWVERGLLAKETSVDRFERFLDIMADDSAADPTGRLGKIGLLRFLDRGGTYGGRQPYGWDNFGDIPWGDGYCDLHYDWPAAILSGFLRTGDPRLLARGRAMAEFRRDYAQNHAEDPRETWRGAAFYEKGWWHGNSMPGMLSHNWVLGVLLHYVVTGDEGSREAAIENAAFVLRSSPGTWTGWWGSRIQGWAVDCLVDAYNFIGDARYLDEARKGVARYEELELADGGNGYHLNPSNHETTVWMENIMFDGAAKCALASADAQALPLLSRMRNWFKRSCIIPPRGPAMSMTLPAVFEQWSPTKTGRASTHHLWAMAGSLSYSAVLFDDSDDRMWATILFESAARYWQEGPGAKPKNPLNASSWSPITMRPLSFPNSESKVLANILNDGEPHLAMRALEAGPW